MSWREVFERDLTSVYRARTGTAVTALVGLFTVGATSLIALTHARVPMVALVGSVAAGAAVVGLVFLGTPRLIGGALATYACFSLVVVAAFPRTSAVNGPPTREMAVVGLGSALSLVLPLVAMLGTYAALVGERERGSVRFLYGLPNARDDVYLAKYLSRAAFVVVPLVAGLALSAVVATFTFEPGAALALLGIAVVSVPYALLFVGAGMTASALGDSENQTVALVVAILVAFRAAWPALQWLSLQPLRDPHPRPEYYFWLGRLNPMNAYVKLTTAFVDGHVHHPLLTSPEGYGYEAPTSTGLSLATSHELASVVVLAWTVVVPLVGLAYYRRRDLL